MPDGIKVLLNMLAQFTGGRGGIDHVIVNYGLAAIFYGILFLVVRTKYRDDRQPRERLLVFGFAFAMGRELFMIFMAVLQALGFVGAAQLHAVFPPFEHLLLNIGLVLIAGAFLRYLLDDAPLARKFLWAGISAAVVCYVVTAWPWAARLAAQPTTTFGKTWYDLLWHVNASWWLALAAGILFFRVRGKTRNFVLSAVALYFLYEFLKIPDILLDEAYENVFAPLRVAMYLAAIPLIGFVYIHEQSLERQKHLLHLEDQVRARTQAEQLAQAKTTFLTTLSHEIRTPMNGVIGMTQLLSQTSLSSEQREFVSTIHQSGEAMLHVLNDTLDYAKIEAGRLELEHRPFKLLALANECSALFAYQARQTGIPLGFKLEGVPQTVVGDALRIRQVLLNLLGNAYKFTREGRISLRITVAGEAADQRSLRFEVQDTGPGMSLEQQTRMFQAFGQVDASIARRYGGSGLGLAISQNLVKLMRGDIGVQSTLGQGSTFWFTVPLELAIEPEVLPVTAAHSKQATAKNHHQFPQLRVLVADDNAVNRLVMSSQLKHLGIQARMVEDGAQALNLMLTEHAAFDLVFMDCEMPHLDGYQAAERLRQWEEAERCKPLFICGASSHAMSEFRERALGAGMNSFITKPLRIEDLEQVLQTVVARQQPVSVDVMPAL